MHEVHHLSKGKVQAYDMICFVFQSNIYESKRRRKFWVKRQVTDSANIEQWLLARQKVAGKRELFFRLENKNEIVAKQYTCNVMAKNQ